MFGHIFSPLTSVLRQIGTQIAQTIAGTMLSQLQKAHRTVETASKHAPVERETNLNPQKPNNLQTQHGDPCNNDGHEQIFRTLILHTQVFSFYPNIFFNTNHNKLRQHGSS